VKGSAVLALVVAGVAFSAEYGNPAEGRLPLKQVADVALSGNPTRMDYQSLDPQRHLLFISHMGDNAVIVVDTHARRVVATIHDIAEPTGVLAVPELSTVYASAAGSSQVVAIDERTLTITRRIEGGAFPDGIAFDPGTKQLFVSDERGTTDTVIDTTAKKRVATIALGGEVGNTQYDSASHHIFVNIQTLGQLVEIDPRTNAILRRTLISRCVGNHGLLVDTHRRRAFIACEDNATLVWLDLRTRKVIKFWTVGEKPDVLALDPSTHLLYVASESGVVSVFLDGAPVSRIAQALLAPAAHTVAVDPATHLVYFPLENVGGRPVLRVMQQRH
jgi:DNA-binding beta-propeller fold protein YncE